MRCIAHVQVHTHGPNVSPALTRESTVIKQPDKAWVGDNSSAAGGQNEWGVEMDEGFVQSAYEVVRNVKEPQESWSQKQGYVTEGRPQKELQGL